MVGRHSVLHFPWRSAIATLFLCLFPGVSALAAVVVEDDFESYDPGPVKVGEVGKVNDHWFTFAGGGDESNFEWNIDVVDGAGREGSRALRITAGVRPETQRFFYVGARRVLHADLGGVRRNRLRLTANARLIVTGRDGRKRALRTGDFTYAFRLESIRERRARGLRQFNVAGSDEFTEIGGTLGEAIPGPELNYGDLKVYTGPSRYQVVIVISSCCAGSHFMRGDYLLEVVIDDLRLETVEPRDGEAEPGEIARFAVDLCRGWR